MVIVHTHFQLQYTQFSMLSFKAFTCLYFIYQWISIWGFSISLFISLVTVYGLTRSIQWAAILYTWVILSTFSMVWKCEQETATKMGLHPQLIRGTLLSILKPLKKKILLLKRVNSSQLLYFTTEMNHIAAQCHQIIYQKSYNFNLLKLWFEEHVERQVFFIMLTWFLKRLLPTGTSGIHVNPSWPQRHVKSKTWLPHQLLIQALYMRDSSPLSLISHQLHYKAGKEILSKNLRLKSSKLPPFYP